MRELTDSQFSTFRLNLWSTVHADVLIFNGIIYIAEEDSLHGTYGMDNSSGS